MSCGVSFMKFTLIFFNVIFLLIGLAGVGVGIWIAVDPQGLFNLINFQTDQSTTLVQTSSYVFIAACAFILIVAAFGIFGACTGNRCMLGFYAFCVIIIFALELAALITVVVYDQEFRNDLEMQLRDKLRESYANKDDPFTGAVDEFQREFECCGITNTTDYTVSMRAAITLADPARWPPSKTYPKSCYPSDNSQDPDYFKQGCYPKLREFISTFAGAIIGIVVAILVFEMILFTFAICLCRHEDFGDKVV